MVDRPVYNRPVYNRYERPEKWPSIPSWGIDRETLERRSETNRNVSIDSINSYTDKVWSPIKIVLRSDNRNARSTGVDRTF